MWHYMCYAFAFVDQILAAPPLCVQPSSGYDLAAATLYCVDAVGIVNIQILYKL